MQTDLSGLGSWCHGGTSFEKTWALTVDRPWIEVVIEHCRCGLSRLVSVVKRPERR